MNIAYLDIFVGISGDMLLGALVDAGCPLATIQQGLGDLPVVLTAERVTRGGLRGTLVCVEASPAHHPHAFRSYQDLAGMMNTLAMPEARRAQAERVLRRLAEAEARVHGIPVQQVHFHELGGLDTIADIVGTLAGLEALGLERVHASPIPLAHGWVDTAHGRLPVPPPAVMELVRGFPTRPVEVEGETVTPTGAALVTALAAEFGGPPPMTVKTVAYGAGQKEFPGVPNLLRLIVGEARESDLLTEELVLVETNLDDMNPELQPALLAALFEAGALDAWLTPIQMKKGRPALLITALTAPDRAEAVAEALLRHSTSFGLRLSRCERRCLPREMRQVETPWGAVSIKVGFLGGKVITASPEYEDCARLAETHGVPIKQVYAAALGKAQEIR